MFQKHPFICKKQLLRNEIHSLDTSYEGNVQSSIGMKTRLISHFWLKQDSWDCNPGLEADIRLAGP